MDNTNPNNEPTQEAVYLSCTELSAPDEFAEDAANLAIDANPQNAVHSTPIRTPAGGDEKLALAMSIRRQWKTGATLTVSFMNSGSVHPEIIAKIKEYANIWTEHANIKFDFDAPHPAMIRVAFIPKKGHNSYVGTDCLSEKIVSKDKHTMNLDPNELNLYTLGATPERFRQIVLHEFGHALGCVHEHQQPDSPIQWNTEKIYQEFAKPPNEWTKEKVDFNIINRYKSWSFKEGKIAATKYDEFSIMEYFFDAWMTKDGYKIPGGNNLSGRDKEFIASMYPFPSSLDTGVIRYVKDAASRVSGVTDRLLRRITVPLAPPRTSEVVAAPSILLGVNAVNAAQDAALRIECELVEVAKDRVVVELRSGGDDSQETTGCAWFKIPDQEKDMQFGRFSFTPKGTASPYLTRKAAQKVVFERPYKNIPKVTVWVHAIDCDADSACNFDLRASDVTTKGFSLYFYTLPRTKLRLLGATWLAHSADRVDIATGSFSTQDIPVPASEEPAALNSGVQPFEGAEFSRLPKVFLAFNQLETAREGDARVLISYENIKKNEMNWHVSGYGSTVLECASVSYIALEPVD